MCLLCSLELRVLERLRKRRRPDSEQSVTNVTNMTGTSSRFSSFVQSALRHTPTEGTGENLIEKRTRKSGSGSRKKQRLGLCMHSEFVLKYGCI